LVEIRDQAFLRMCGTMLKLGRSKEILNEMAHYFKQQNLTAQTAPPGLLLVAGYAYLHQKDYDQSLAWFGAAYNRTSGQGIVARRALTEARRTVSSIPTGSFEAMRDRWSGDAFAGPIFSSERMRRAQGAKVSSPLEDYWFNAAFYAAGGSVESREGVSEIDLFESETPLPEPASPADLMQASSAPLTLGLLLPFSGQFAEHAARVKEGIELAAGMVERVNIIEADTQGDAGVAERQYEDLVRQGVNLVFGPLLVKTSEQVARKSADLYVPFISFTKREGFPALSGAAYRLGATGESQVRALVAYAAGQEGLRTFSIIYPKTSAGAEFARLFRDAVERAGGRILSEADWENGDPQSVANAINQTAANPPQAIFVPDSLENSLLVLQQVKTSALSASMVLGPALWDDPVALRGAGQLVEDAVYVSLFNPASSRPIVTDFTQRYKTRFARPPDLLAAQAYDAATFAFSAVGQGPVDAQEVIKRLNTAPALAGVTGALSISADGEIVRLLPVVRIYRGEAVEVVRTTNN
ncbi:MAG TPA: penicillin-binding protein activator, partial [Oligoflexia bacterium]|nr:penicillin-binding protein activator [Oligoflexia bacterium]